MSKESKIVSVTYTPEPILRAPDLYMYGRDSGRPLFIGDTVTENDGAIVVIRAATGANIPAAHIRVSVPVRL